MSEPAAKPKRAPRARRIARRAGERAKQPRPVRRTARPPRRRPRRTPGPKVSDHSEIKEANPDLMASKRTPPAVRRAGRSGRTDIVTNIRDGEMFKAYAWVRGFYHPDFPPQRFPDRNPAPTALSSQHLWRLVPPYVPQTGTGKKFAIIAIRPQAAACVTFATAIDVTGNITWGTAINHPFLAMLTGEADKYRVAKFNVRIFDVTPLQNRGGSLLKTQFLDAAAGQPLPTNIDDIYSDQANFFVDLASKDLAEETSSAPILIDEAANDMVYLSASTSQPVIMYISQLPSDTTDQDLTFQLVSALEFVPFADSMFKYDTHSCTGDPNMVSTVLDTYSARLDGLSAANPSDWTWRGIAESILDFGKKAWGPVRAVANVLTPIVPFMGTVSAGMGALSGLLGQQHHLAMAAWHLRFEAYKHAPPASNPDPTDPYGPYYLGLVGSPLAPFALRRARKLWDGEEKQPTPDRDPLLDSELRAQALIFAVRNNTTLPPLAPGHLVHDLTPHGDTIVLDVEDSKGDNYLVRIIRNAGTSSPTDTDYLSVEQRDDDAKSSASVRSAVGALRSRSQPR